MAVLTLVAFGACNSDSENGAQSQNNGETTAKGNEKTMNYDTKNPVVEIEIKDYGTVAIELYPDVAPNTVNNFISLVKSGFYDNNKFHRCIAGFMLQGGDPTGTGTGGPGYSIKGEFSSNGFKNDLLHTEGVISMARSQMPDSAGSQFFIMLGTAEWLDGEYAAFGMVIEGMDVVDAIASTPRNMMTNKPKKDQRMGKVRVDTNGMLSNPLTLTKAYVDTHGVSYPEPEKVK